MRVARAHPGWPQSGSPWDLARPLPEMSHNPRKTNVSRSAEKPERAPVFGKRHKTATRRATRRGSTSCHISSVRDVGLPPEPYVKAGGNPHSLRTFQRFLRRTYSRFPAQVNVTSASLIASPNAVGQASSIRSSMSAISGVPAPSVETRYRRPFTGNCGETALSKATACDEALGTAETVAGARL